jgi:hypothetical protein
MENSTPRLAVLIDAENAQLAILPGLLAEIAKIGTASVKRVYGDFTSPNLAQWRPELLLHSIQPIQQFRNTVGKNASDSALIIDAMDLLHSRRLDGFCIVSSDSDFTRLAARIREEGLIVFGYGEHKTPTSFIAACDRFVYTEVLRRPEQHVFEEPAAPPVKKVELDEKESLIRYLADAVEANSNENGWASLAAVGSVVANHVSDFDPRHYGCKKLSALITSTGAFDIEKRGTGDAVSVFIKLRAVPVERRSQ